MYTASREHILRMRCFTPTTIHTRARTHARISTNKMGKLLLLQVSQRTHVHKILYFTCTATSPRINKRQMCVCMPVGNRPGIEVFMSTTIIPRTKYTYRKRERTSTRCGFGRSTAGRRIRCSSSALFSQIDKLSKPLCEFS